MPVTLDALLETQRAFDTVARTYNRANAENPVLSAMRRRTIAAVIAHVPHGSTLVDLGCGPGPDVEHLARRGYRVTAIDWSPEMVHETARRVRAAGLDARVDVRHLGIHELAKLEGQAFDGAYSNLGPLNCVPDLRAAAGLIADRLKPGGVFVASVIGRVCPWEIALYGLRGDWTRVGVRFSREFVPVPFNGRTVWTRYYAPGEFERTFVAAGLTTISRRSLGLVVPPPYLQGFAERHPALLSVLERVEDRVAGLPVLKQWGDHFLIVMRRRVGPRGVGPGPG